MKDGGSDEAVLHSASDLLNMKQWAAVSPSQRPFDAREKMVITSVISSACAANSKL